MMRQHFQNYFQKYNIIIVFAIFYFFFWSCNTTKKVENGSYLLIKNKIHYEDKKVFAHDLPSYILQKPNKKDLLFLPLGLIFYNAANPKYDSIFSEYVSYPRELRDQKLRDSLYKKYKHPELVGKGLFLNRFFHISGQKPTIYDKEKSNASAISIRKQLEYRGYWDAKVYYTEKLDSVKKIAKVKYNVITNTPTIISEYYYDIKDPHIKKIYEQKIFDSHIRAKTVLDQTVLEKEVKRITEMIREKGYFKFNNSNEEISFSADTLKSTKEVPLILEIKNKNPEKPYKISKISKINVIVENEIGDYPNNMIKDSLRGINFYKSDESYKTNTLWRAIVFKPNEIFSQKNQEITRKNILLMNNFNIISEKIDYLKLPSGIISDSLLEVEYKLKPLDKYNLRIATDINYSQLLNFAAMPSVDLTKRNLFGGAQNLNTNLSWIVGRIQNTKNIDERIWAHEFSANASLTFPKLLLPFNYYKVIPKRYSPNSYINLGGSLQKNMGLDRININTGITYNANANDITTHRLTLFNTQFSLTRNSNLYYDFFPREREIRDLVFQNYSSFYYEEFLNGNISSDDLSSIIFYDSNYYQNLSGNDLDNFNRFAQSKVNKDRLTENVLISSLIYQFTYNEINNKEYKNPLYFSGKLELAGNTIGLFKKNKQLDGKITDEQNTVFGIPYSQFIKFDLDFRKYFTFGNKTLVIRQFVGLGLPYGNSFYMPFVRSYFNGGANDIRAWRPFGGLGPGDSQLDERVRTFAMENVKLTTNIEYRFPLNEMYEFAIFTDAGNIWNFSKLENTEKFSIKNFIPEMGVGSGFGLRVNIAYITLRFDFAYKVYNPNLPIGNRWEIGNSIRKLPTINFAFGYPF